MAIEEVVVSASRVDSPQDAAVKTVTVIDSGMLQGDGGSSVTDILDRHVPGLAVTGSGIMGHAGYGNPDMASGNISMRGMSGAGGRVLVLVDGHPQYASIYGHPVADSYTTAGIERVEVSHGASSVLYGSGAMGGVINIITAGRQTDGNTFRANLEYGSYNTVDNQIVDSYRDGDWAMTLSGGIRETDGHRDNSAFSSENGMAVIEHEIGLHWKASANLSAVQFKSENPGLDSDPMVEGYADIFRGGAQLLVSDNYERLSGAVAIYRNWGRNTINDGFTESELDAAIAVKSAAGLSADKARTEGYEAARQPYLFHSTDFMEGINLYQSAKLFSGNTLTAGIDASIYGGDAWRNPVTEVYADSITLSQIAGYALMQQDWKRLTVSIGLRYEHHSQYGSEWLPQFGAAYRLSDSGVLRASASKGFRTPNLKELYMYASANEDLLPEEAWSYDLGLEQQFLDGNMSLGLSLFHIEGSNLIETVREGGRPQNRNTGSFANSGIEASVSWQLLKSLKLDANYSFLEMEKDIVGSSRHKAYAVLSYVPGALPKLCVEPDVYVVDGLVLKSDAGTAIKTSSFCLAGLRLSWQFNQRFKLYLKGHNLLNADYQTVYGMPMPGASIMAGMSLKF